MKKFFPVYVKRMKSIGIWDMAILSRYVQDIRVQLIYLKNRVMTKQLFHLRSRRGYAKLGRAMRDFIALQTHYVNLRDLIARSWFEKQKKKLMRELINEYKKAWEAICTSMQRVVDEACHELARLLDAMGTRRLLSDNYNGNRRDDLLYVVRKFLSRASFHSDPWNLGGEAFFFEENVLRNPPAFELPNASVARRIRFGKSVRCLQKALVAFSRPRRFRSNSNAPGQLEGYRFLGNNAAKQPMAVVRKRYLAQAQKLHPNKGGSKESFQALGNEWARYRGSR
jgi:hypothetical protein